MSKSEDQPLRVTFDYYPDPDEQDETHETGLTADAYSALHDRLSALGADNIQIGDEDDADDD